MNDDFSYMNLEYHDAITTPVKLVAQKPVMIYFRSPAAGTDPLGGHAMCLVGYDLKRELLLARNSFGAHWCMGGYCWITFDYMRQETMDNWVFDVALNI
jgi:C1A family cysteine protease